MKVYDISQLVRPGISVWPGDTPYRRELRTSLDQGDVTDSSTITISLHTGTHLDAPGHYLRGGTTVDKLDPSLFIGPAEIVSVTPRNGLVELSELHSVLSRRPERLLIRANLPTDLTNFPEDYVCLSVQTATALAASGVRLVGLDSPSVDHFNSGRLPVHEILGGAGIVILENLKLDGVRDGTYQLIALPLKLQGADGSPIRAVLVEL